MLVSALSAFHAIRCLPMLVSTARARFHGRYACRLARVACVPACRHGPAHLDRRACLRVQDCPYVSAGLYACVRARVRARAQDLGVLAKATHESTVRFAPPLVISEEARRLRRARPLMQSAYRGSTCTPRCVLHRTLMSTKRRRFLRRILLVSFFPCKT